MILSVFYIASSFISLVAVMVIGNVVKTQDSLPEIMANENIVFGFYYILAYGVPASRSLCNTIDLR